MVYEAARNGGSQYPRTMGPVGIYLQSHLDRETGLLEIQFQAWASGMESRIPIPGVTVSRNKLNPGA